MSYRESLFSLQNLRGAVGAEERVGASECVVGFRERGGKERRAAETEERKKGAV